MQRLVMHHAFLHLLLFFILPSHFEHNTVGHIPHTKNSSHLGSVQGHKLLGPVFKTPEFRGTQTNSATSY